MTKRVETVFINHSWLEVLLVDYNGEAPWAINQAPQKTVKKRVDMKTMTLVMLPLSILLTAAVSQASDKVNPIPSLERYAPQSAALTPADTGFNSDVRAIGNYNGDLISRG